MYPDAKLPGLSAMKIRYPDGQRDLAEELFEDCTASKMTRGEAVVRGILPAPVSGQRFTELKTDCRRISAELTQFNPHLSAKRINSIWMFCAEP